MTASGSRYNKALEHIDMPDRVAGLPIASNGYPVPWFVQGSDPIDFRTTTMAKVLTAINCRRCWVCGGYLGIFHAFVVSPMGAINRVVAEPASHRDCAIFAAVACPFLSNPGMVRSDEKTLPTPHFLPSGGMLHNPGMVCVWITRTFHIIKAPRGVLIQIGDPELVKWYTRGRDATLAEVTVSIQTAHASLNGMARSEGVESFRDLQKRVNVVMSLLPP